MKGMYVYIIYTDLNLKKYHNYIEIHSYLFKCTYTHFKYCSEILIT